MSRFDATRTTEIPEGTWTVPIERQGNVIYQHSVWNVDYSKIDAVIIDGVRFSAERTCKPVEKDGVMRCPDCDYPLGIMSVPAYCAGCGAKVVSE